jgi:hypothetical protein
MVGVCGTNPREEKSIVLVEKNRRKESLARSTHRWENNIKMDLKEKGWVGVDRIPLPQSMAQ